MLSKLVNLEAGRCVDLQLLKSCKMIVVHLFYNKKHENQQGVTLGVLSQVFSATLYHQKKQKSSNILKHMFFYMF